ncbi:hypothetical protein OPU71_06765 [Niveibacterium sp. 24ML]|uniref:hypothetical protein n=1 Tax=Niveibacterium sp. 24ML TaxID=2985512 RepID=UPI00227151F0|nr:hypothetical protein [Niveibacterium sp. 24ML]MCX9155828.1 hypothetical protein [Niveibacterium sp. 24ML]
MNDTLPRPTQLLVFAGTPQRLGVSADQLSLLYQDSAAFRTLWDDYVLAQLGLKYWTSDNSAKAESRRFEYLQTLSELESEIHAYLRDEWDIARNRCSAQPAEMPAQILETLRTEHGITGPAVYFAPLLPLVEIAWMERRPSDRVIEFLFTSGEYLCRRLSDLASGLEVLPTRYLLAFTGRFMCVGKRPPELERLASLGRAYLKGHSNPRLVHGRERLLWRCAYQIAHSNADHRPNWAQWYRLLDLLPRQTNGHESEALARTPLPALLAELERASVNG